MCSVADYSFPLQGVESNLLPAAKSPPHCVTYLLSLLLQVELSFFVPLIMGEHQAPAAGQSSSSTVAVAAAVHVQVGSSRRGHIRLLERSQQYSCTGLGH